MPELGPCAVCTIPAENRCAGCKTTLYCSKEHQKQDWKTHKFLCKPPLYKEGSSPELGRYLVAARDIEVGQTIITETPIIIGPKQVTPPVCLGCLKPGPKARCQLCKWPLCDEECPGWDTNHAIECAALVRAEKPLTFSDLQKPHAAYEAITLLRLVLMQKKSPKKWKLIQEMEANEKKREPSAEEKKIVQFLLTYVGLSKWGPTWDTSEKTLHRLAGVLQVNALDVRLPHGGEVMALFPTTSLIEHSCIPNIRIVFDPMCRMTVSASKDIKEGEHLQTMYTHALWATFQRREHLFSNKQFWCKCPRCSDPTELGTMFGAMRCVAPDCGGFLLPTAPLEAGADWACTKCVGRLSEKQIADLTGHLGQIVDEALAQPTESSLKDLLEKLNAVTHENHFRQYAVKHSLIQLMAKNVPTKDELDEKQQLCEHLLKVTQTLDPGGARLAVYEAVICYELHNALVGRAQKENDDSLLARAKVLLLRVVYLLRFDEHLPEGQLATVATKKINEIEEKIGKS
ncbi:Hypothetical predicted protein [Cloeon dipterum]|uniref:MYND-type domain-containing protein n=1 Tax=Cloeon dipterum TaxID=197152 RepID=A0A8S1BY26_9INSE|nr:Hypothetical predicted protein [Cloeon dipterum]